MVNLNIETQETLIKHINSHNLKKAEKELEVACGKRYIKYRRMFQLASDFKYEPEFPLYIMLEQTYRCNLRCPSCIHGYPELRRKFDPGISYMPWNLYERIVLEGKEHACPSISMHSNDEPLLVKDLSKRISFARKHGFMDVIVTTNGTLFTKDKIREIIDAGVTRILFSIDALSEETYKKVRPGGNLHTVLSAINIIIEYRNKLKSHLPILRASFVPNALNEDELETFVKTFSEIVDYVDIQPFSAYYGANAFLIPKRLKRVSNFCCSQPWTRLIVRGNGDMLPCCSFYGSQLVVGNAYNDTLKEVFNSKVMRLMRKEFKDGYYRNVSCKKCSTSMYEL